MIVLPARLVCLVPETDSTLSYSFPSLCSPTFLYTIHHLPSTYLIMKGSSMLAASGLLGAASAGVHKMKLNKVPLSQQLVSSMTFATHPRPV